jgi:hypothetical protein
MLSFGCSNSPGTRPTHLKAATADQVGEIRLSLGGAISRDLRRDRLFQPFEIHLAQGSVPARLTASGADRRFEIGMDSARGAEILTLIAEKKPWEWQSLKAEPFANGLFFDGTLKEQSWHLVAVYPDKKLATLIKQIFEKGGLDWPDAPLR